MAKRLTSVWGSVLLWCKSSLFAISFDLQFHSNDSCESHSFVRRNKVAEWLAKISLDNCYTWQKVQIANIQTCFKILRFSKYKVVLHLFKVYGKVQFTLWIQKFRLIENSPVLYRVSLLYRHNVATRKYEKKMSKILLLRKYNENSKWQ